MGSNPTLKKAKLNKKEWLSVEAWKITKWHKSHLLGTAPAELFLFFSSLEIKAVVSTLGPDPSHLKQTAYATWEWQLGTAESGPDS